MSTNQNIILNCVAHIRSQIILHAVKVVQYKKLLRKYLLPRWICRRRCSTKVRVDLYLERACGSSAGDDGFVLFVVAVCTVVKMTNNNRPPKRESLLLYSLSFIVKGNIIYIPCYKFFLFFPKTLLDIVNRL
jgi:hypothetical protein